MEYFLGNKRFRPHPLQLRQSRNIKAFLPEMNRVNDELESELEFKNTEMFPNFRFISEDTLHVQTDSSTLRLVFLARVDKNKGYYTIFNFAEEVCEKGYDITIDFYGPINSQDKDEFLKFVERYKSVVSYKGILQQEEITDCLVNYDVMLLPTTIYTEGFPGSILDAYIAGIPVIVTEWKHSHEFVDDQETGYIVSFDEPQSEFNERILTLYHDRDLLSRMKTRSFRKRLQYSDKEAWAIIAKYL